MVADGCKCIVINLNPTNSQKFDEEKHFLFFFQEFHSEFILWQLIYRLAIG